MSIDDNDRKSYEDWMNDMATGEPEFDESLDGAERASAFLEEMAALMKKHRVNITGKAEHLQQCYFNHDDEIHLTNGWMVDFADMQSLKEWSP